MCCCGDEELANGLGARCVVAGKGCKSSALLFSFKTLSARSLLRKNLMLSGVEKIAALKEHPGS